MPVFQPAAALREFDRLAALDATPEALAWLASMRPRFMAQTDALVRARFLLRTGALRDSGQPIARVIDDLLLALAILRRRGLASEVTHALARLAYWYQRQGLCAPALWAGRQALARPTLPSTERTRLQVVMVSALALERLMDEAWAMLSAVDAQRLPRPDAWMLTAARANLHQIEALRARRLVSTYTLDLLPDQAPDHATAEHHLAACERLLDELPPRSFGLPVQAYMKAVACAVRQDRAGCVQALSAARQHLPAEPSQSQAVALYNQGWCQRVLGELEAAQASHQLAWAAIANQPVDRLQGLVCLDLAACARALGREREAWRWMDGYLQRQALLRAEEHRAMAALARVMCSDPGASPEAPIAATAGVDATAPMPSSARSAPSSGLVPGPACAPEAGPWPAPGPALTTRPAPARAPTAGEGEGEPAILAQAEALYLARLPRRLSMPVLARALGVSVRTLQLASRRHRQCTLGEMLRHQIMVRARSLLRESTLSIAEVAQALGYLDASSLSRDVRRHFGCTPRALRAAAPLPRPR